MSNIINILSFDVGIKHLAFCFFSINKTSNLITDNTLTFEIINWDVINLLINGENEVVNEIKCKKCDKKATVQTISTEPIYLCTSHSKKHDTFKVIDNKFKEFTTLSTLSRITSKKLSDFLNHYKIEVKNKKPLKSELFETVFNYIKNNCFVKIGSGEKKQKANDYDLVKLGINLKANFDRIFTKYLPIIDYVIIENQIGPLAIRMKSLQAMVTQYFIMNNIHNISYVSSVNKLKIFENTKYMYEDGTDEEILVIKNDNLNDSDKKHKITNINNNINNSNINDKKKYKERKNKSIEVVERILVSNEKYHIWLNLFKTHKKKDDLADSLLQGLWFSNQRKP